MDHLNDDANLRLVRFFGICLASLVFVYALLGVRLFPEGDSFAATDWFLVALGMVLLLSYMFVRKTIGWSEPVDRGYLPFFFLGAGFRLVETKAITELGLHLGGTWFVVAATIAMVLVMAFLANFMVQRNMTLRTNLAYLGLLASLLVGYFAARDHGLFAFASPLISLIVACVLLTVPLFF